MRAVRFDEYGGPGVLHLSEVPEPRAEPGQVRVQVQAFSINPMEYKIRSGSWSGGRQLAAPQGTARDVAGVIDQVGEGVSGCTVGDPVYGSATDAAAELAVVNAWARIPQGLSFTEAASLPMAAETSARTLDLVTAKPPALILMDGAAGGVGTVAVQLAVARGYDVIGTASEANHDYLRSLRLPGQRAARQGGPPAGRRAAPAGDPCPERRVGRAGLEDHPVVGRRRHGRLRHPARRAAGHARTAHARITKVDAGTCP